MNHLNEDEILSHVLGLSGDDEPGDVASHLADCKACQETERTIRDEVERLSNVRTDSAMSIPPQPVAYSSFRMSGWLRAAAILLIGFMCGLSASRLLVPKRIVVEPMSRTILEVSSGYSGRAAARGDALGIFSVPDLPQ